MIARGLYALVLRLVPRSLRQRAGAEMRATFEARLAAERSAVRRAGAVLHELGGLMRVAVEARTGARVDDRRMDERKRRLSMLETMRQDVTIALRSMRRSPGFTATALLSLALGVGATAAVFGAIANLLLDPLPVEQPDELAVVYWNRDADLQLRQLNSSGYTDPADGQRYQSNFSHPLFRALRDADTGADVFAFTYVRNASLRVGTEPPAVGGGLLVDGGYFVALRPRLILGRGLTEADDRADAPLVAVLSHGEWQRAFGGARDALGKTIRVNGVPATVVGVTAAEFEGVSRGGFFPRTEVTLPLSAQPLIAPQWSAEGGSLFASENVFWLRLMARVPDAQDRAVASSRLAAALRRAPSPVNEGEGAPAMVLLAPGARGPEAPAADTARLLWILLGAVGLVLLIVCVNLASLMLARGVSRERDIAVRRALGSGRGRIMQHTLIEGLVLSVLGTALGLLLVVAGSGVLTGVLSAGLGGWGPGGVIVRPQLDWRVLTFALAACVLTTLVFSLAPALRMAAVDPGAFLKHRVAGASGPRLTVARLLVGLQIAISVPLVTGAVLLLRTFSNLNSVDVGFDPRGLVMFQLDPGYTRIPEEQYADLYRSALQRLQAIPGVQSATLIENPFMSGVMSNTRVGVGAEEYRVYMNAVGPDFIPTMGLRLIAGRMPQAHEDAESPRVAALNETAARRIFGAESPLGRVMKMGDDDVRVVGVVSDSRYERQRGDVRPILYDAALQRPGWGGHSVVLRSELPLARLEPEIRSAISALNPDLPVPDVRTQLMQMERLLSRERVFAQLLTGLGLFALLLASIGLHGVTAYAVSRRTSEIGVRVAFGARPRQVLWLVLRQVALLAVMGAALGVPAAIVAGPVLGSLLFGVEPTEPLVIAASVTVMMAVAITAGLLPARTAARLDPMTALRRD